MPFQFLAAAGSAPAAPSLMKKANAEVLSLPDQAEELTRDLFDWLSTDSLSALFGITVGVGFYFALVLLRGTARRNFSRHAEFGSWRWVALKVVARTRSFFLVMVSARLVALFFGAPATLTGLISFLFTVAAAVQGAFWAREFLIALVERKASSEDADPTMSSAVGVLTVIINVAVWAVAGIILLDNLGVNVTTLIAGLGVGGIAIGLAAQGIFSDLFAALSILLDRPFKQGDTVQVGGPQGFVGTVEHIGLKTTRFRALSGEIVVMSNANLLNQQINNFAAFERRRVVQKLGVTYQTPAAVLATIPSALGAIVEARDLCHFDRAHLVGFGAYSIDFELVYFVNAAGIVDMLDEQQAINLAILARFEEIGAEFAYPTQVEMQAAGDGTIVDPREPVQAVKRAVRVAVERAGSDRSATD